MSVFSSVTTIRYSLIRPLGMEGGSQEIKIERDETATPATLSGGPDIVSFVCDCWQELGPIPAELSAATQQE